MRRERGHRQVEMCERGYRIGVRARDEQIFAENMQDSLGERGVLYETYDQLFPGQSLLA